MSLRPPANEDFQRWLRDGTLTPAQAEAIRGDLAAAFPASEAPSTTIPLSKERPAKGVDPLTVAYYAGALLIVGAMAWFLGEQWDAFSPDALFFTTLGYAALFGFVGYRLRFRRGYPNAGGLLIACAVWMVPFMTYALEAWLGIWPTGKPGRFLFDHWGEHAAWMLAEAATATAGILVLRFVRFPFLVSAVAASLWLFALDAADVFWDQGLGYQDEEWITVAVGILMLAASFMADRRFDMDLAFWGYLFGLAAFWGGLSFMHSDSELNKAGYAGINLLLIALSVYLNRRVFLVFGTLGLLGYFYHLADDIFDDSPLFPLIVAMIGLGILLGAVYLQRHASRISSSLDRYRPRRFRIPV